MTHTVAVQIKEASAAGDNARLAALCEVRHMQETDGEVCVCVCLRARMRACVRVHACVHVCAGVCVCVCVLVGAGVPPCWVPGKGFEPD